MALVLITGVPGSGKSILAAQVAAELGRPLIAKDRFKEILFDALGTGDRTWSQRLGHASIMLQYEVMRMIPDAVVDSALWTGRSEPEVISLGLPVVQVFCRCDFDTARSRFFERSRRGERHGGFAEELMEVDDFDRFRPLMEPLQLKAPLLRVDTACAVDVPQVVRAILAAEAAA